MVKCSKSEVQRLKTALRWKILTIGFNLFYAFVMVRGTPRPCLDSKVRLLAGHLGDDALDNPHLR